VVGHHLFRKGLDVGVAAGFLGQLAGIDVDAVRGNDSYPGEASTMRADAAPAATNMFAEKACRTLAIKTVG